MRHLKRETGFSIWLGEQSVLQPFATLNIIGLRVVCRTYDAFKPYFNIHHYVDCYADVELVEVTPRARPCSSTKQFHVWRLELHASKKV
jgi:hypothetical protein